MPPPCESRCEAISEAHVVIPVQQDTIDFDGYPVIGVRLPDGRIGASLRDMCNAMKIDRPSQVQRIRGDETIADSLVSVQIATRGGPQVAEVLTAWAIPYWLTGVDLPRIKDEKKRHAVSLFKRRAADVLYQHFSQRTELAEPSRAVVAVEPTPPAADAGALAWAEYHRHMAAFFEWRAVTDTRMNLLEERLSTLETQYVGIEEQLEGYKPVLDLVPEILDRLGPETLTPDHQRAVQHYVKRLHEATGKAYATIYDDLKTAFSVPRYQEISEAEWETVVRWFTMQIERARDRRT